MHHEFYILNLNVKISQEDAEYVIYPENGIWILLNHIKYHMVPLGKEELIPIEAMWVE